MLKRPFLKIIPVILISLAIAACGGGEEATPASTSAPSSPPPPSAAPPASGIVDVENQDPGGSGEYKFSPSEFTFKLGQSVVFSLTAESELHNFSVEDLGIDSDVKSGELVLVNHTFDKVGTFRLICIFHVANGMEGTITVVQ